MYYIACTSDVLCCSLQHCETRRSWSRLPAHVALGAKAQSPSEVLKEAQDSDVNVLDLSAIAHIIMPPAAYRGTYLVNRLQKLNTYELTLCTLYLTWIFHAAHCKVQFRACQYNPVCWFGCCASQCCSTLVYWTGRQLHNSPRASATGKLELTLAALSKVFECTCVIVFRALLICLACCTSSCLLPQPCGVT